MKTYYSLLFLVAQLALSFGNNTLCRPDLCMNNEVHVGCFHSWDLAPKCGQGNLVLHVNGELKDGILDRINNLRNFVASGVGENPVAARMPTMIWDYNLQRLADNQVRQCDENGKYCANTERYNYVVTTQIRSTMTRHSSLETQILDKLLPELFLDLLGCQMNESLRFVPKEEGACVGHFVPLVQDRGARMGCAIRLKSRTEYKSNVILLCHFSRASVNGLQPFEVGVIPGEKCVSGSSQLYKYLCNEAEAVDPNSMQVDTPNPSIQNDLSSNSSTTTDLNIATTQPPTVQNETTTELPMVKNEATTQLPTEPNNVTTPAAK